LAVRRAIRSVNLKVFENQLSSLKFKRVLVVLVVDATDPLGSFVPWAKLRVIVGSNPIFVAFTKCDLLPAVTGEMLRAWHGMAVKHYGHNVVKARNLTLKPHCHLHVLRSHLFGRGPESPFST
jgi:ribosome biogenesis GTPase A